MNSVALRLSSRLGAVSVFFLAGLVSGSSFAWLTSVPSLREIWFIEGDKFATASYAYWFALSGLFSLGIGLSYLVCALAWTSFSISGSGHRCVIALVLVALSAPALAAIKELLPHTFISPTTGILLGGICGVGVLALCLWLLSTHWYWPLFFSMLVALVFALILTYFISLTGASNRLIGAFQFSSEESLTAALSGYWLVRH